MGLLDASPTGNQEVTRLTPTGSAAFFCRFDHEILSTVILSLPLMQAQ